MLYSCYNATCRTFYKKKARRESVGKQKVTGNKRKSGDQFCRAGQVVNEDKGAGNSVDKWRVGEKNNGETKMLK